MKSMTILRMISIAMLALVVIPAQLAAAQATPHYIAIDMGTLGGPNADFNLPGRPMNAQGAVIFSAETATPDPLAPYCSDPECLGQLGIDWQGSVKTPLESLPGTSLAAPFWINDSGLVVGESEVTTIDPAIHAPQQRAVLWKDGAIQNLGTLPGGDFSDAFAVNDQGLVTGPSTNGVPDLYGCNIFLCSATQTRGFVWQDGVMKDMGTLGGPDAIPLYINDQGQIAGESYTNDTPNSTTGQPTMDLFLWQNGKMRDLGNLGGTLTTLTGGVDGLNSRGEVIGTGNLPGDLTFHPVLWDGGRLIDLGTVGGNYGSALAVNEAGHVVGWATTSGDTAFHGFLWEDGRMIDLGIAPGQTCALANAVNAQDQVVGGNCDSLGDGWLWEHGTIYDLNSLVTPSAFRLAEAHYVDDRGEIVCRGVLANGDVHIMLLVPSGLAASEGLTSNVPAGSLPARRSSDTRADLNNMLHASRFRSYPPAGRVRVRPAVHQSHL